jgi:hypothetical protein
MGIEEGPTPDQWRAAHAPWEPLSCRNEAYAHLVITLPHALTATMGAAGRRERKKE